MQVPDFDFSILGWIAAIAIAVTAAGGVFIGWLVWG